MISIINSSPPQCLFIWLSNSGEHVRFSFTRRERFARCILFSPSSTASSTAPLVGVMTRLRELMQINMLGLSTDDSPTIGERSLGSHLI